MCSSPLFSAILICFCTIVAFVQSVGATEPVWVSPVADRAITQLAVSADQSRVAGIVDDTTVIVLNGKTGELLDLFTPDEQRIIKAVALSPDGTTLYVLDVCYPTRENQECNCLFRRKIVGGAVLDSRIMVEGSSGDVYTHSSLDKITIRISSNGKFAAIGTVQSSFAHDYRATTGRLFLYNSELDSLYAAPRIDVGDIRSGAVHSLDISSDGSRCFFYTAWDEVVGRSSTGYTGRRDSYYIDYSIATHTIMRKIDVSIDIVPTILFSPDNYFLILGKKVYDYPYMQLLTEVSNPLQWLGTGTHVAGWKWNDIGGRDISIVNPFTGSEEISYSLEDMGMQSFDMAKGGSLFFTGFANGSIACWGIPDTIQRSPLSAGFRTVTTQVQMLDSVQFVNTSLPLSAETQYFWDFGDGIESRAPHPVHVYTQPGKYTVRLRVRNEQGEEATAEQMQYIAVRPVSDDIIWFDKWGETPVSSLAFSSDGELVAAATGTQQVMLKHTATGETITLPPVPQGRVGAVAFPGDGKTLYSISSGYSSNFSDYEMYSISYFPKWYIHKYNEEAKIWTTSATIDLMQLINRPLYGVKGSLNLSAAVNAAYGDSVMYINCRTQTFSSNYGRMKFNAVFVLDIQRDSVYQWNNQQMEPEFMSLAPDGSRAVAINASNKKVQVLEARTGGVLQQLSTTASCTRFLDSTATIITNGGVWRAVDGTRLRALSLSDSLLFDVFSKSRAAIVAMPGSDSALAIYAIEKDSITHHYGAGLSHIVGLAVSPDGRFVATGGETGHVAVWRIADAVLPLTIRLAVSDTLVEGMDTVHFYSTVFPLSTGMIYEWDFGDGMGSNDANPVHIYRQSGEYIVRLRVRNERGEEANALWEKRITVRPQLGTGSDSPVDARCTLAPNPVTDYVQITIQTQTSGEVRIELLDYMGKPVAVRTEHCEAARACVFVIPVGHIGTGVYICRVSTTDGWQTQTFVVRR